MKARWIILAAEAVLAGAVCISLLTAGRRTDTQLDAMDTRMEKQLRAEEERLLARAQDIMNDLLPVMGSQKETLLAEASIHYTITDFSGKLIKEMKKPVPAYLYAMNREQLQAFLDSFYEDEEIQIDGYVIRHAVITSFSPELAVVSLTGKKVLEAFYFHEENGRVVVYLSDRETVYEPTAIRVDTLPEEEKNRLREGFFVYSAEEVFSLLESYTS